VFYCTTDEETIAHAKAGHCIAREMPDEAEMPAVYIGQPSNVEPMTQAQTEALQWRRRESGVDDSIMNAETSARACPKCQYPAPDWRLSCRVCGFEMGRVYQE
jgi:hypothetical protein